MAETANILLTNLAARVRDPQMTATTQAQMLQLLSEAQRIWNMQTGSAKATATLTLEPRRLVYPIEALLPDAARITHIRFAEHQLSRVTYDQIRGTSHTWFRDIATRPEQWTTIGRDLLIIHPGIDISSNISVTYTKLTTTLSVPATTTDIDDDQIPNVIDIAEALVHLRTRHFDFIAPAITRLASRSGIEAPET